jgi:dynactin-4
MVAADTKASPQGAVLYIDHARHLTPLTLTYHATASRHLTSGRSDIIPPSTSVEVETAYCPRCLTFCDAASASTSLGVCQKDAGGCKDCPLCFSTVSISIDKESSTETHLICHYVCGHCSWSSQDSGVTVSADKLLEYSNNDDIDEKEAEKQRMSAISEITEELENCFQRKVSERNQNGDALFHSIGEMWAKREQDEERRKRMMISSTIINESKKNEKTAWSLGALEDSLVEKKRELISLYDSSAEKGVEGKSSPNSVYDNSQNENQKLPTSQQMAAQMSLTITAPRYQNGLLPLPVRYRTRVSRRCRAEQSAGRTGILVKPKLNPLEGDTSLRAGHGQWWKKDSSAVHVVPRVQLCRYGTDPTTGRVAALLKVKNPTLNMIRLRFSCPDSSEGEENIDTKELENILIDPFMETTIAKADLCSSDSLSSMEPSDWIELDSAEDLLLDIGKRQEDDPQLVRSWDFAPLLDALDSDSLPKLTIVASRRDTSWVEMILPNPMVMGSDGDEPPSNYFAVPLSMQIEVGNGSWEASLIKRCDVPEREQDLVRIDLVVLLHM